MIASVNRSALFINAFILLVFDIGLLDREPIFSYLRFVHKITMIYRTKLLETLLGRGILSDRR